MSNDPLADVINEANRDWWSTWERAPEECSSFPRVVADAVRAAGYLSPDEAAEAAEWAYRNGYESGVEAQHGLDRAHLAAVLDAEEAHHDADARIDPYDVATPWEVLANLRAALGVAPTDREGG